MCKDLETQAQDYAEKAILRLRGTIIATEDTIFSAIAEAYKQGYALFPKDQDWCVGKNLELVTSAPTDPKREFLEKLKSLLREFDAKIQVYAGEDGDCGIGFYFGEPEGNHIWYTNEWGGNKFDFPITTDNIMDFDKD